MEDTVLKILILEDTLPDLELTVEHLTDAGYKLDITHAENETGFREALRDKVFDIIISDFNLPEFDAFGALEICKELCPDVPFICLSGAIGEETAVKLIKNGAADYVQKDRIFRLPFTIQHTLEAAKEKVARNKAEVELKESEALLSAALELAQIGSWKLDLTTNKQKWSDEVYRIFGCQPQEFNATYDAFLGFVHPDDRMKVEVAYSDSLRDNINTFEIEHRIVQLSTGEVRHVHERCVHIYGNTGKVIQSIGMVQDITERIKAEEQILRSEKKYKTLFYDSPEAFLIIENGIFIDCNTASEKLFGSSRSDIIGKTPDEISPEYQLNGRRSDEYAKVLIEETFAGQRSAFEWLHTRKDGTEFLAQINLTVIEYNSGTALLVNWQDITELRRAENQLRKLWSAVEQSPVSIMITDLDGKIEYCNPVACSITGYSYNEMIGKNPRIFQSGETNRAVYQDLWNTVLSGKVWQGEFRNRRKSGEFYLESCTISPVKDSTGAISHYIGIKEDITERKRIQEEIEVNELRHRLVAGQSRTVIWEVDLNGLYTYVSEVSSEVYGYKPEELVLKRYFFDLHPEETRERFKITGLELINSGKKIIDFDNPIETKEGETIWVSTSGTPINDKNGRPIGFRGSDIDITGKKKIEAEIRDINANLEQRIIDRTTELQDAMTEITDLYENAPCGYHSLDSSGLFLRINSTELSWLGYTSEEVVGKKKFADIVTPQGYLKFKENFPVFKKQGFINDLEFELVRKDGTTFLVSVNATAVKDRDGNYLMSRSTLFDITARKHAETALEKAMQEAESANKAKSEFLANMSHEIRTPMNAVLGYTELLGSTIIDQTQKGYVNSIKSSGKGLLTLINDILDLSKIEAGKLELEFDYVDTKAFFSEFERIFSLKVLEKGLKFNLEIASGTPPGVYIDESRVRQVIFNLLGNAIKFTKEGAITLKVHTENPQVVNYKNYRSEEFIDLVIEVEDSGIGISRELQESIFQPFTQERGSKHFGGTGLGLTITKRLLTLMNGSITVFSETGKGSRFTVMIPEISYLLDYASSRADIRINPSDIIFSEAMILIVDDVEHNRSYLREALKNTQLHITEAENGVIALNMAKRIKPDLIIADIRMPEMDGFQLLHKIKSNKKLKHIPVLAYSASVLKAQKERIHNSDFSGLLIKPVNVTELYLALMNILPYKSIRQENNHDAAPESEITGEIIDSSGLIYSLGTTFTEKWKAFAVTQPLDEISDFAQELLQLGLKHNCLTITDYAKGLANAADSFNVETLLTLIRKYKIIVEKLKNSIK